MQMAKQSAALRSPNVPLVIGNGHAKNTDVSVSWRCAH